MLKLILGRAGTGKTEYVTNEFAENKNTKKLFLSPEQFTLETERRLLSKMDTKLLPADYVLSFSSLPRKYYSVCGGNAGTYIDDFGRMILMNKAVLSCRDGLQLYKNQVGKQSFVKDMLSLSLQSKTSLIAPERFLELAEKIPSKILSLKLSDAGHILSLYDQYVKEKYLDGGDDLTVLAKGLSKNRIFEGYDIYVDGFHSFSLQEEAVLIALAKQANTVTVTFPCPAVSDDGVSVFSNVTASARHLMGEALKNNIETDKAVVLKENHRFKNEALRHIEKYLFSENAVETENSDGVTLTVAATLTDEAEAVARKIHRDIRENGGKYSDCAVVTRDLSMYGGIIESAFLKYDVPFFMDKRENAVTKPLFRLVISALRLASGAWQTENLFACLKTGYFNATEDEIFILENYIDLWSITGNALYEEYTLHPDGYTKEMSEDAINELTLLNDVRSRVMPVIKGFCSELKGKFTGEKLCRTIFKLMTDLKTEQSEKEEDIRVYSLMTDILDQLYYSVGNEEMDIKSALELSLSAMESAELKKIPPTLDGVVIGTADRIRIPEVKRVYIMGLNDGEFPQAPKNEGIFGEEDKEILQAEDVILGSNMTYWAIEEMFISYKAFCASNEEVHLFTRRLDKSGATAHPSQLVTGIKRLFKGLKIIDLTQNHDIDELAETASSGISALAVSGNTDKALLKWYDEHKGYRKLKPTENSHTMTKETAAQLFKKDMRVSATKIEDYHKCRFAYFCKHGLRVREKRSLTLKANEIGSFVHFVLENVLRDTKERGIYTLSKDERNALTEKWLNEYFVSYMGGETSKSARFTFMFKRLSRLLELLIDNIAGEMEQSEFSPDSFELNIGKDIKPTVIECDEGTIVFEGSADRVDVMKTEEGTYLRVIDYKTGAKKFKLSDVLYGLNMQMLIYLVSLWKGGEEKYGKVIPAGILYFPATHPKIETDSLDSQEKRKEKLVKELRMNGLILEDIKNLEGMEKALEGMYIPVARGKSGLKGKDSLATLEQLGKLSAHIERTLKNMHRELNLGNIEAVPVEEACKYCEYRSLCGFEAGVDKEISVESLKNDKVWERIDGENESLDT